MKLFFSRGACSLASRIIIHELNLTVEYIGVDLKTKKTESGDDYWKINSKGTVPALMLEDQQILTENAVILQYLAEKQNASNLLPAVKDMKRYRVLEWLNYISSDIHKSYSPLFNHVLPQDIKEKYFIPILKKKLTYINKNLLNSKFLMGEEFTLPDAYLFVMLLWLRSFKIDLNEWPELARYYAELRSRPSIQLALDEEGIK